jgi:hypothetical protein
MSACNIGRAERRGRRRAGIVGLAGAAILAILLAPGSNDLQALVAAPLFGGLLGLVQSRVGFCVAYGLAAVENLDDERTGTTRRLERSARLEARLRALGVVTLAGAGALVLTSLYIVLV